MSDLTKPTIAVVICTRDRPAELERCLAATAALDPAPSETLVVDNASKTPAARVLAGRFGVRYVSEPTPGLSRARNTGARACTADLVAYTDDDAVPERDWLLHLAEPFGDESVMAVCGRVVPLSLDTEGEIIWAELSRRVDRGDDVRVVHREDPLWFEKANFGVLGDGNNQAIRRRAFELWRGYDERLGRGTPMHTGEDHYSLFELLDLGFKAAYTPRAVVRHPLPSTLDAVRARRQRDFEDGIAYCAFLARRRPRYALRVLRFALEGLARKRRPWHAVSSPSPSSPPVRANLFRGVACGLGRFLMARTVDTAPRSHRRRAAAVLAPQP